MLAQLISRAGQARRTQQEKEALHERWVASDAQRKVGMDPAARYVLLTTQHVLVVHPVPSPCDSPCGLLARR